MYVIVCVCVPNSDGAEPQQQLTQRQVIVQRDKQGYGFTVTGHNPVFIQTVKESMSVPSVMCKRFAIFVFSIEYLDETEGRIMPSCDQLFVLYEYWQSLLNLHLMIENLVCKSLLQLC